MSLVQFTSGHLLNSDIIRSVTPIYVLQRERALFVSAGAGVSSEEYGVFVDTAYWVDTEWSVSYLAADEDGRDVVTDMLVGKSRTMVGSSREDLSQFLATRAKKIDLGAAEAEVIGKHLARLRVYHDQIAALDSDVGAPEVSMGSVVRDSPSPEMLQAQLEHRVRRLRDALGDDTDDGIGVLAPYSSKPVNGFLELSDRLSKLGIDMTDDVAFTLKDTPVSFIRSVAD